MKKAKKKARATKSQTAAVGKTIEFAELKRLSFANSPRLPEFVNVGGARMQWIGIGWFDCGKAHGDEVVVVENGNPNP